MTSIKTLDGKTAQQMKASVYAHHIDSIPGFGLVCSVELAGEIGALTRFTKQSGFLIYIDTAPPGNQSGAYQRMKSPK